MSDKKNTIGRFEILEKIGEGPIGAVYKALDPVIRRTVAIKVIKLYTLEETATFAEVFEKIYRVVRTSTALNHPNICIIYDLSEEKKIPFITMEFVDGHDLEWLLQNKHQFKRAEVLNILQQTCDALDFAHRKNVIHQDLKSTNIILTSELHVKITDFGIAGLDEIAAAQTKKLLSIPYYISPEQALGDKVTPASDLFSLGIIMYQMLSGQLPFPGTSAANVIMMIARDNAAIPKDLEKSGIKKDDWDNFFSIALAKAPGQRFRSAKEMFDALTAILPSGETRYFPYSFQGEAIGSEKLEKTFVNETPTVMIDPSQFARESAAEPAEATMVAQPASAFDLLEEAAPAGSKQEPAEPTLLVSKDQLQPAAPPTVMIEIPKQPLKQEPAPKPPPAPEPPQPPPFVSTTAPTQMISMQDFAKSDLPTESESESSGPVHIDEISLPEAELPDMATLMVQREPAPPPKPAPPAPPPKPPQPEPMATMRPTPPTPEPIVLSEQAPPEEEALMTMRPAPPAPPEPKPKKETPRETGRFKAAVPPPPAPPPPEPVTPVPAPPPPAAATGSMPRPAAAARQPKPGGGSL
ncbi:MAG TPA: serine/threonine-protein kinase, partial [Acidobacteriota bacterium]|nr:serine/threonine-protein kinase [Acidobacteriota bacterium]